MQRGRECATCTPLSHWSCGRDGVACKRVSHWQFSCAAAMLGFGIQSHVPLVGVAHDEFRYLEGTVQ